MNEKAIKESRENGALISSYSDISQLEQVVRWKILDAQRLRGQQIDENTLQTICKKTAEVLKRDYPNFSDKELDLVLESGISGKLGKETWVSGASVLQWLSGYTNNPVRIRFIESENESKKEVVKLSKEEISEKNRIALQEGYKRGYDCYVKNQTIFHKEGFAIPQWPSIIYTEFRRIGKIAPPTEEQRAEAKERAEEYIIVHPLIVQTEESNQKRIEDMTKCYLLEAHYKDIAPKEEQVRELPKVDMDFLYNNI